MGPDQEPAVSSANSSSTLVNPVIDKIAYQLELDWGVRLSPEQLIGSFSALRIDAFVLAEDDFMHAPLKGETRLLSEADGSADYEAPRVSFAAPPRGVLVPLEVVQCAAAIAENLDTLKALGEAPLGVTWQGEHLASVFRGPGDRPAVAFGPDPDAAIESWREYRAEKEAR